MLDCTHDAPHLLAVPAEVSCLTALTAVSLEVNPMSAPGALDPLAALPRLERLELDGSLLRRPSRLAEPTALRELKVNFFSLASLPHAELVERGPYLRGLRGLHIFVHTDEEQGMVLATGLVGVRRQLIEPLRAATALAALWLAEAVFTSLCALVTADDVEDLLEGKLEVRELAVGQQILLEHGTFFRAASPPPAGRDRDSRGPRVVALVVSIDY